MKPEIEPAPDHESPDGLALATLAAQARFVRLSDKAAVSGALALLREAQAALDHERKQADASREAYPELPQPKDWPASFDDFLKLIVRGKDSGDQLHRFRDFLRWKVDKSPRLYLNGQATDQAKLDALQRLLSEFRADKYTAVKWQSLALEFRRYWTGHKTKVRQQAGKKGAAAKATAH